VQLCWPSVWRGLAEGQHFHTSGRGTDGPVMAVHSMGKK